MVSFGIRKARSPKVIVVTDRKELDKQIAKTFTHTRLTPARATSGKNLCDLINEGKADVITSIINKFNTVDNQGVKNNSRDIFVLVDESHRSNYGSLATKMRTVFPNACYIGFTGTPLLKNEKNTLHKFGKLIHKYTIKDGVEDKAIVPLIYEGRFVDQKVDEENIDLWFKMVTKKLNKSQIAELKAKWSSIQKLTSSDSRIRRVAIDIYQHFMDGFKESGFKAMLACNFKRDAVRYKQIFDTLCDIRTEVVISAPDMREGHDDVDESSDDLVVSFWNKMMKQYDDADDYEDTLKSQFYDGEIDILIVCSKLLTGYDAPRTQVLYIDKELKDHGLLQAIARTNRLYEGKDFGLIVDYRGLISKLDAAMEVYSGAYGNTRNAVEGLTIKATPTVITGKAFNIPPRHGITLYAKLPEGYYEDVKSVNYALHYISFALSVMLMLLIVYYLFKTKRKKPVKVIEFYPPDGISSAEVGTIIDDSVDAIDMASLIPWLAGQGYISIEEKDKGSVLKRTETVLTKLKDLPDSAPEYQKKMMKLLFKGNQTANLSHMAESPSTVDQFKTELKKNFKGEKAISRLSSAQEKRRICAIFPARAACFVD